MRKRKKERLLRRKREIIEELHEIREAKRFIRTGKKMQNYTEGSRQVTRYAMSLAQLDEEEKKLRDDLDEIDDALDGISTRRAYRTVFNDEY